MALSPPHGVTLFHRVSRCGATRRTAWAALLLPRMRAVERHTDAVTASSTALAGGSGFAVTLLRLPLPLLHHRGASPLLYLRFKRTCHAAARTCAAGTDAASLLAYCNAAAFFCCRLKHGLGKKLPFFFFLACITRAAQASDIAATGATASRSSINVYITENGGGGGGVLRAASASWCAVYRAVRCAADARAALHSLWQYRDFRAFCITAVSMWLRGTAGGGG